MLITSLKSEQEFEPTEIEYLKNFSFFHFI